MRITKDNLKNAIFENENARLLILDVVSRTATSLYYYYDVEITEQKALDIWRKAFEVEGYSISFLESKCTVGEYSMESNRLDWKARNRSQYSMINPMKLDNSRLLVKSCLPQ